MTRSSSPAKKTKAVLSLQDIVKTYHLGDESFNALDHVNLDIFPQDLVSIVGPSGSGKSTLLQIAGLLDRPTSGTILINQEPVLNFKEHRLATLRNKVFGFVFQQFNLLAKTSALDNVMLPLIYANIDKSTRISKATAMLQKVGLGDKLSNTPAQLSGGQQQRVAIARALVNDPQVIFADEPTGNLDSKTGTEIIGLIKTLNQEGKTIVIVTHEEEVAQITTRRITLKDGKISTDHFKGK